MKKVLFIAAILTAFQASSFAQETARKSNTQYLSLGPVAGVGLNWVSNMAGSSKGMVATNFGIGLIYAKDDHWGWGGQLVASAEGYNVSYNGTTVKAMPLYLRMPLRAYYFFGDYKDVVRPKIYLGPSLAVKLSENDDFPNHYTDAAIYNNTGMFRTFDLGINAGAGVNIKVSKATWLNLDLGYTQGLMDVVDDPASHYNTNQNLAFNAGVLFGL